MKRVRRQKKVWRRKKTDTNEKVVAGKKEGGETVVKEKDKDESGD